MQRAGAMPQPPVPFVVHEVATGTPLLVGRVVDPRGSIR